MEDEVAYYYDSHATEKDRMGQPSNHADLLRYLWNVVDWLFQRQTCAMYRNLNFYQTSDPFEYPQEYFAYDPYEPLLPESGDRRLFGWQLDQDKRIMKEMSPAPDGSLWSQHLESRLVPDGYNLRLYDNHNQMRLTGAVEMARQADELRRQTDALRRIQIYSEKLRSLGINPDQII